MGFVTRAIRFDQKLVDLRHFALATRLYMFAITRLPPKLFKVLMKRNFLQQFSYCIGKIS